MLLCRSFLTILIISLMIGLPITLAGLSTPFRMAFDDPFAPPLRTICEVQGRGSSSPFNGSMVRVQGVVFADLDETSKKGFFMQEENCDGDPETSDGVFVYLDERSAVVSPGDRVEVTGQVQEYFNQTEIVASGEEVRVISSGNLLAVPVALNPPAYPSAAQIYLETLEGMAVVIDEARVVGPTNARDETWITRSDQDVGRVFWDDLAGMGEIVCVDDGGPYEITPEAKTGDRLSNLNGFLEYSYGIYRLELLSPPVLTATTEEVNKFTPFPGFSIATFNLANLFDTVDDPIKDDDLPSATEYQRHLGKIALAIRDGLGEPGVIAVQEVENQAVLEDLIARPELTIPYDIVWRDSDDRRGIDIALLYRPDQVDILEVEQWQGCTNLEDGLGPDGNDDVLHPSNVLTCDIDGDGELDGNRLFSRFPLVIHLQVCSVDTAGACLARVPLWLIANHWKSKSEDTVEMQYTLPRRMIQAQFVADLFHTLEDAHPGEGLVVLGDLNDDPDSGPILTLEQAGLSQLISILEKQNRFTYNYQGVSQVLDYIMVNATLAKGIIRPLAVHINADYPVAYSNYSATYHYSSDHDPLGVHFLDASVALYLPVFVNR
jgi:predicted extracellular nuclease